MVDITFFELHLDGADITANAPFSGSSDDGDEEATVSIDTGSAETEGGRSVPLGPIVGLLLVVVLLVAAKKLLGGDDIEAIDVETE